MTRSVSFPTLLAIVALPTVARATPVPPANGPADVPCDPARPGYDIERHARADCTPPPPERKKIDVEPLFHGAVGVGAGTGGFRANLDLGVAAGFLEDAGLAGFSHDQAGFYVGPSLVTGFGAWPTYAIADLGYTHLGIAGASASFGPVLRLDRGVALGGEVRGAVRLLLLQVGVRGIVAVGGDVQVCGTIGIALELPPTSTTPRPTGR